jgi:amino acid adenylation domain-containing protein
MEELLLKLKELDINLKVDDDNLKIIVPKDFDNPNIVQELKDNKGDLITYLNKRKGLNKVETRIPQASLKEAYALTPAQFRIFLLNQFNKDSVAYNQTGVLKVTGELDAEKLGYVFKSLLERHECFRMSFSVDAANQPVQQVLQNVPFEIEEINGVEGDIESITQQFIRPFDLSNPPLIRVGLMQVSEDTHFILIDMHHIASDGVSVQILMREFTQLYQGEYLVPLQTNFKDYAEWFLSEQHQASVQHQKDFWLAEFNEMYDVLELPYDFPRPKEKSFEGSVAKFNVSNEEKERLNTIIKSNDITLFTLLLGVYGILLSKLSRKSDLVIGTLVAGRKRQELENIIGMFANTLALPISLDTNLSFTAYAQALHQKVLSYLDNDEYPYEELINELRIERDPSRNPLFDCVFVLQNNKQESFKINTGEIQEYQFESTTAKFDLTLGAKEDASGLSFELEYATDLFTESTIENFINYYKEILKQIAENPAMPLAEVSLLSSKEKETTLEINNFLEVSYPESATIIDLFEEQAAQNPDSVAVVYEGESLTYAELNNLANLLAYDLRSKGIGRNDIVGLLTDKNLYTVAGMLGILKSGGCYMPLDPSYPEGRIRYMLEDSKTDLVITTEEFSGLLEDAAVKTMSLETAIEKNRTVENIVQMNNPEDMCYIIYTSGTTGNPKGVMVEHGNVVRLFYNEAFQFNFDENDVWTMFHSHCFDFSVWEMYGALLFGGKVVIIPSLVARDPSKYVQLLKEYKVTVLNQTPTAFNNLMEECERQDIALNELRYVIFGGEALVPYKLKAWKAQHPHVKLVNMYGITEVTVHATYKEIGTTEIEENVSNLGKPIPTTSIYILDENQQLVPQGVVGEIYVGGAGITRGYLHKEELTNTKFLANPFREGERFYRSGDLGRLLKNGEIEYLGRIDSQVQLKGFRIELKEIEHNLLQQESIQDAVVIKRDSEEGHPYLCAYYIGEEELEVSELRAQLGTQLPKYMIPSYFVKMDEFPMTSNNKIAVAKLPSPSKESLGESYVAPTTEVEKQVVAVWEDILQIERIGVKDNYFSLGGDSLKAIGLIANINKALNVSLTIADLYSYQTAAELAEKIASSQNNNESGKIYEETVEELRQFEENYKKDGKFLDTYEAVYPMNGVEKGMVFLTLKSKPTNIHEIVYHEQNIYDYPAKNFDFGLFKHAVNLMVDKHTTLRKIYDLERFAHIILKTAAPEVNLSDIRHLDSAAQDEFIKNKLLEEKLRQTELSFSLLWRINIIQVTDDYQYLLLDFHHSFFDGWSLSSFVTELSTTYATLVEDNNFVPTTLQSSYKDQIIGEIAAAKNQASVQYWQEELEGYLRLDVPATGSKHEFKSEWFDYGRAYRSQLEELASKYNTSFKHLCFAAYIYAMNMLSYEDDITLGVVTNNRPLTADGERLLGCFLNTIPFRAKLPKSGTWGDYINFIEDKLRTLKYHERVPFYKILEIIEEPANENNPIFDIAFNYIDFRRYTEIQDTSQIVRPNEFKEANFYMNNNTSLDFHIYARDKDFRLTLTHSTAAFSTEDIEKLSNYFKATLDQFLNSETAEMGKEVILAKAGKNDRAQLAAFNATKVPYETDLTILDLFKDQVNANPDKVAVQFEGKQLTFSELDAISNQLAHVLIKKGVTCDTLVPICVDRSLEMIIGIVGILKAGGAYVPIDPAYPENRITYILDDTKPALVLTVSTYEELFGNTATLNLDDASVYSEASTAQPNIHIPVASLAYVIYTSGTTGNPKGVMNQHDGIYNRLVWMREYFQVTKEDNIFQKTTFCFDVSVWELLLPLMTGAKLVFAIPGGEKDPAYLQQVINEENISMMHFVPSALSAFLWASEDFVPANLRAVVCSGEALKAATVKEFRTKFSQVGLFNLYGPTEAAIDVTAIDLTDHKEGVVTIGKPVANTQIHIVDKYNNVQPVGVLGELLIGGIQVARGYLNKSALTAEKFINSPFNANEKLYKTGDLARWLPDGTIEYLGRNDHQVKIRGYRIELKEIEHRLLQQETIQDVAVLKRDSKDGNPYLCAYYVGEEELEVTALRAHLGENLPNYMIPSYFVKMDAFPLTANSKLAKSKLPVPNIATSEESYVAPQTEAETKMVAVWEDVLQVSQIGIKDNYFILGGDSLKAIALIASINNVLDASLIIADLYSHQTVEELAKKVASSEADAQNKKNQQEALEELRQFEETYKEEGKFLETYEAVYPMNGVEKGMVFEYLKNKSDNVHEIIYHQQYMYDFPAKNFDLEIFNKAVNLMINKHAALRKIFDLENFAHIVMKEVDPEVNFIDIQDLDKEGQKTFVKDKLLEEKQKRTDLAFSLLWRVNIIKVRDDYQYLLFDFHHSLFDGWSFSSFLTETLNTYATLVKDGSYVPALLQTTYKDQIVGELAAVKNQASLNYWQEELDGYTRFELPSTGLEHEVITDIFELGTDLREDLEALAARYNTSFKHLCFAAYVYTMNLLSFKSDVTLGITTNNRPLTADGDKLLGCFLNIIPFRAQLEKELTWGEYINYIEDKLRALKYHEKVPFSKILEVIKEPAGAHNPVFDTAFSYTDFQVFKELEAYDASVEMEEDSLSEFYQNEHYAFGFYIEAHDFKQDHGDTYNKSFKLVLRYSTTVFDQQDATKLADYFKSILGQFLNNEEAPMRKEAILSEAEKANMDVLNDLVDVSYPRETTIIDLFEAQVEKFPDAVAVAFEDETLTYRELNNQANILAYNLRARGIGRNDIVGLMVGKELNTVVGMLGILKAGGCYMPLDPTYPQGRINYMLEDSQTEFVITSKEHEALLGASSVNRMILEDAIENVQAADNIVPVNSPEDMCYIIYTSGTTGNPKGVMVEHENVVRLFYNNAFQFEFGPNDVWTMFHSHCFDFSVWEMYGALLFGGKVVIVPTSIARDPSRYIQLLKDHQVTVLNQTPTAFNNLIEESNRSNIELNDLRYVIFGGEALVPFKLKSWKAAYPQVKLINMYGITEVTVHATFKEITTKEIEANTSNLGKPIPTTSIYILDENQQLVPQGVTGEIYVGGAGITRGYLNKEELTNAKFMQNPYRPEERYYRSGDLGRLLENGEIEYLGRIDSQVQLKGFRIELKEIEHNLLQQETIQDAVVIMRDSDEGHPYLCAYYIGEEVLEVSELRAHLEENLPKYMIPSYFVKMEEFPMTSSNKIATAKLPSPDREALGESYVAPTTEAEMQMVEIWQEVLKVSRVGIQDNYFSLGGDSLKAISLISKTNSSLGTTLTLAELYSYQTVEELAKQVTNSEKDDENKRIYEETLEELRQFEQAYKDEGKFLDTYEAVYPMNGVEKGMAFHSLKGQATNIHEIVYHEQNIYDYPVKDLDFGLFRRAIDLMVDKHSTLRKIYDLENFAHIIMKKVEPEVNFWDICHLSSKEQEDFIENKLLEEKNRQTNLSFSILWRINVIKVRDDYQYLQLDFHHSLFDGWSLSSFLTETLNIYSILIKDENYVPALLQSTYKDQIISELSVVKSQATIDYWQEELDGYTRFELPSTGEEHEYITDITQLGNDFKEELEVLATRYNTSFKHLCFAACLYTMNLISYEDDLTLGIVSNNRPLTPDGDKLLGCFLNTVPFRSKLPKGITWGEYINYVEDKLRALKYHESVPFYKILEMINEPAGQHNPIFDIAFNYIDFQIFKELEASNPSTEIEEDSMAQSYMNEHFPIGFHIEAYGMDYQDGRFIYNKSFKLALRYSTAIFSPKQATKLATYFKLILEQFLYSEAEVMNKNVILAEADKDGRAQLDAFNATTEPYETGKTILDLFKEQVASNPEKIAAQIDGKGVSFSELDRKSNQLANILVEKGVTTETMVPICIDRSLEMIIGIVGILKAGGAYVPIDPDYPQSRIDYILNDIQPALVLTASKHEQLFSEMQFLNLDDATLYEKAPTSWPAIEIPETSLAYVIYTSGTTGNPKGVMNQHDGIYNRLVWMRDYLAVTPEDNILQKTTFCFDVSVWELLLPLMTGAKLVFAKPDGHKDATYLQEVINQENISIMHFVPSALSVFLLMSENYKPSNLRAVVCSGEELKLASVLDFRAKFEGVRLHNLYGPTEAAIDVTAIDLTEHSEGMVTIGSPVANTQIHIVDDENNIQPIGVKGELLIGGIQVARGYVNKPELTAKKFIASPFEANGRLYKTGDVARWLPNGTIEYMGRNDHQVKIRGHRIELGEIENAMLKHPQITNVVVVSRAVNGDNQLVAYYLTDTSEALDIQELKNYLRISIPEYMVPAYFMELEEMPVTHSGKVDRKSLPDPKNEINRVIEAPQNEEEAKMLAVWAEILNMEAEEISITDNFFDIGGHSLNAMKLNLLIRKTFAKDFNLKDVFNYPIARLMTEHVVNKDRISTEDVNIFKFDYNALENVNENEPYIATFEQRKEFMRYRIKGSQSFNITSFLAVQNMDMEVMKDAIAALFERHEVLRTTLYFEDGDVKQKIHPQIDLATIIEEVAIPEGISNEDIVNIEAGKASNIKFDLEKGPWLAIKMLNFTGDTQGLLIAMHHVMSDNSSAELIKRELTQLYNNLLSDNPQPLKPLKLQYKDFAVLVNKLRKDTEPVAEKFFADKIKESLAMNGNPYEELIKDPKNSYNKTLRKEIREYQKLQNREDRDYPEAYGYFYDLFEEKDGAQYRFILPKDKIEKLEKIRAFYGTSNFLLIFSIFSFVLREMKSSKSTRMLLTISTRVNEDFDDVIGWLASTILTIISEKDDVSVNDYINNVSDTINETSNYRFYNFEKLLPRLDLNQDIIAPGLFNYLHSENNFPGKLETEHIAKNDIPSYFNFACHVEQYKDCILFVSTYKLAYLTNDQVEEFWTMFSATIDLLAANPETTINKLMDRSYQL